MNDFGQGGSQGVKRGRPKKKPDYDKTEIVDELLTKAVELFEVPYDDRVIRDENAPTLISVARALNVTLLKARKLLITAGYYSTAISRKVQEMHNAGAALQEIMDTLSLGRASVHSYLPYQEGAYKLDAPSLYAEQSRRYRQRKQACAALAKHMNGEEAAHFLWNALEAFQDFPFHTEHGELLKYKIDGKTIHFVRQNATIEKEEVKQVFRKVQEIQRAAGFVAWDNRLPQTDVNEYLILIFLRIGVIK